MEFQELVCLIADETTYTRREIRNIMRFLVKVIRKALGEGRDIHLPELGYLRNIKQAARRGRNKLTGLMIDVPETRRLRFIPCPGLRKEVKASQALFAKPDLAQRFGLTPKEKDNGEVRSGDRPEESTKRKKRRRGRKRSPSKHKRAARSVEGDGAIRKET